MSEHAEALRQRSSTRQGQQHRGVVADLDPEPSPGLAQRSPGTCSTTSTNQAAAAR